MAVKTMADYIKRDDAIEFVSSLVDTMSVCANKDECIGMKSMKSRAISAIRDVPAADVVKVVRCRDCKYWNANLKQCFHKSAPGMWRKETFFCANGERKTKTNG